MGRRVGGNRFPGGRNGRHGRRVQALLLLLPVLGLVAGLYLGWRAAQSDPRSLRSVQRELSAAEQALQQAQGALTMQRTRHEVDRRSLEMVRSEMAAQKERTSDLEEALRFYRSLMAPEGSKQNGLSLRAPELLADEATGRFSFRIVVQQEARKHELVQGSLYVDVIGILGGQEVTYALEQLSPDLEPERVSLQFRYFQAIEGELTLPEGFDPQEISVVATASKPRKLEVREQFPWQLQERFTHVGK